MLVVGGAGPGSIGLYAAGQAVALGSERVLYVDADPRRRAIAERFGAETLDHVPDRVDRRFAITVDASASRRPGARAQQPRSHAFDPTPATTSTVAFDDAPDALLERHVKLVFTR